MHFNNFRFDVTGVDKDDLRAMMGIAFGKGKTKAIEYAVRPADAKKPLRLVFFWTSGGKDTIPLPFKLDAEGATDFALRWLAEQEYPMEEDFDGSVEKGWRIYNEEWTRIDDEWRALLAITPEWAMYGK